MEHTPYSDMDTSLRENEKFTRKDLLVLDRVDILIRISIFSMTVSNSNLITLKEDKWSVIRIQQFDSLVSM